MYDLNDILFLQDQFNNLLDSQINENPIEYIENIRYLPKELTPMPGKYSYDRFPFLKEIFSHVSDETDARKIVFMKPAQIGATTGILESGMAYNIGCVPKSQLYVSADKELVKTGMKTKVERMLDGSGLRPLIFSQSKSKGSGDTATEKEYPGGFLHAIGARNPGKLRQMSYMVIWFDELDGFPQTVGNEGSPIDLAEKRTKAFIKTRKIFYLSTPTVTQSSQIYDLYQKGDQRQWYMPCKYCGEMQVFVWHGVTDDGFIYGIKFEIENGLPIYETVTYQCPFCKKHMKNYDKAIILPKGEWRPTVKTQEPGLVSYWTNSLVSPVGLYSWEDMTVEWSKCWDLEKNRPKDIEKLRTFYNTERGRPFRHQGQQIKKEKVQQFRNYKYLKNNINNKDCKNDSESEILLLTCAVDVQKNNLWVHVIGWATGGRNYMIDFFSIDGPTEDYNSNVWTELEDVLTQKIWIDEIGRQYRIINTCVDSGKYTDYVYAFCKQFSAGVIATKGEEKIIGNLVFKLFKKETLERAGLYEAYHLNTTLLKDRIARYFNLQWNTGKTQPPWYPNFPDDTRDDIFAQFEAEVKIEERDRITNKWLRTRWVLVPGRENHCFDTYAYNIACLELIADRVCREELGLQYLDWKEFWNFAKKGNFYSRY
jgi:phage terminase large subunit GpA-like protein